MFPVFVFGLKENLKKCQTKVNDDPENNFRVGNSKQLHKWYSGGVGVYRVFVELYVSKCTHMLVNANRLREFFFLYLFWKKERKKVKMENDISKSGLTINLNSEWDDTTGDWDIFHQIILKKNCA